MSIKQKDIIEISHLTFETSEKFGITTEQLDLINNLMYSSNSTLHCYILDNLFKDGQEHVRYKLTTIEASKLIDCLLNNIKFSFVEYNTPEWHKLKTIEQQNKFNKDYQDYGSIFDVDMI